MFGRGAGADQHGLQSDSVILLLSGATRLVESLLPCPYLGVLTSPRAGNRHYERLGLPWAADNDVFTGKFDPVRFRRLLTWDPTGCLWVAAPDVVGDAAATLELFAQWAPEIRSAGFPVALVGQDGLVAPPWDDLDALFIGGSTEWKLGPVAFALAREAKERGKWVHFGRVNTANRIRYARQAGADSIDGTKATKWPFELPRILRWIENADTQEVMF